MLNAFTYDDEGRITSKFDGNRLLSWDEKQFIDYDDDGRIISERNEGYYGDSTENPSNTTQKSYTYDWLGRVATETTDGVTTSYEYDEVGNLTSKTTGDLTTTYKINELDQVTEVKTNDNVIQATYTYDLSGNRTTKYSYGATTTYTYDGQNNLTSIAGDQQTTSTYTYDANGERLTKLNQTHTTQYYYDGVNLLFTKRNNSIDVRYLYDEDTLYAAIAADGLTYWYNVDLRGSVTNIIKGDTTGSITTSLNKSYVYDAYGNTNVTSTSEFRNAVAYTGAIYDEETGLYYLMSRYYDPEIAQFISEDSYRGDGEHYWNLYAYCSGDPVNNTDRDGNKAMVLYNSADNCAKAFGYEELPKTNADYRERGAVIYKYKVDYRRGATAIRYMYYNVGKGGHDNVVATFIGQRFFKVPITFSSKFKKKNGIHTIKFIEKYAFVHTHPYCTCHLGESFSKEDRSLVSKYGMKICYLATPKGYLYKYYHAGYKSNGVPTITKVASGLPKATKEMQGGK